MCLIHTWCEKSSTDPLIRLATRKHDTLKDSTKGAITYTKISLSEMFPSNDILTRACLNYVDTWKSKGLTNYLPGENVTQAITEFHGISYHLDAAGCLPGDIITSLLQGFTKCSHNDFKAKMDFLRNYPGPLTTLFPGQVSTTSTSLDIVEELCRHGEDLYIAFTQDHSWFGLGRGAYTGGAYTGLTGPRPKTKSGLEVHHYPPEEWWRLTQEERNEIVEFHKKRKTVQDNKDNDQGSQDDKDKNDETPPKDKDEETPPNKNEEMANAYSAILDSLSQIETTTDSYSIINMNIIMQILTKKNAM